jgi:deoxyribodipyrimidine photolyase-related protein
MRQKNFFQHSRQIPKAYWTGDTGLLPVDAAISTALTYGYNHHIDRLMVMGNIFLLTQTNPQAVYQWFMGMYIDAYDWVMVPNVYGMSQFADGGSFATKPYISGANYLRKMSDYPAGDWENTWTALYWNFIHTHQEFFKQNHRLSMMPRLLEKMESVKKQQHFTRAQSYLHDTSEGKAN